MNFKDTWATDESGKKFIFTVEMQRKLAEEGLPVEPDALAQLDDAVPPQNKTSKSENTEPEPSTQTSFEEPESIQIDPQTGKYIGRVKWYNVSKGYGFISRGGGEDIFFHKTDTICDTSIEVVQRTLRKTIKARDRAETQA
ncbi:MAG: cold shock domain-containing protein, partial [Anaerolineales bacterium]|nr:cold shock domain-containing protein [Anaerolineales bacterium]